MASEEALYVARAGRNRRAHWLATSAVTFEIVLATLIWFISDGRGWARLLYAVWLGVRTLNVIRSLAADWQSSQGLVLMTVASFACQYAAMYGLFTGPGRRWFGGSQTG